MANIFLKRDDSCVPDGWENWAFVDNYVYGYDGEPDPECEDGFDVHDENITLFNDAPFPKQYLPARAFWVESVLSHCVFEWKFLKEPELNQPAGSSSIPEEYDCFEKDKHVYGIGIEARDPISNSDYTEIGAPEMGYCVGDVFKQHIYTHLKLEEKIEDDKDCPPYTDVVRLYGTPKLQVLQNSRLKQIYVYEGTVRSCSCDASTNLCYLNIGLEREVVNPSGVISITGYTPATIVGQDDDYRLIVESPWDLEASPPLIPKAGDYYTLDQAWCIEDPFLMSGFWLDNENNNDDTNTSGLNLFVTTHNSPYETGKFMGAYIWSAPANAIASFNNMEDRGGDEWKFLWWGNTNKYFPTAERFKEESTHPNPDVCAEEYQDQVKGYLNYTSRTVGSESEFESFQVYNSFVRVEIQTGGDRDRHNWFAPALKGQYIKVDNHVFEIINHITAHIIDISTTSVDGYPLTIDGDTTYSIINHKAWMIAEHYDGEEFVCDDASSFSSQSLEDWRWGNPTGIFQGNIYELNYNESSNLTEITIEVFGDRCGAWIKNAEPTDEFPGDPPPEWERYNTANNFINRFKQTHAHDYDEPIKKYTKFQDWKLVRVSSKDESCDATLQEFNISAAYLDLSAHPEWPEAFNPYEITIAVEGDYTSCLYEADEVFVAFDNTFQTACCNRTTRYYSDFGSQLHPDEGSESTCIDEGETAPLCLDGGYISDQYLINIPKDYRIGYCEGRYFGLNGCAALAYDCYDNASVFEDYGLYLHITTAAQCSLPKTGIASIYDMIARKDLVAYGDVNNEKLQLRMGEDDFQTRPVKYEFAIGNLVTELLSYSGGAYYVNKEFDRLNKVKFDVSAGTCPPQSLSICLSQCEDGCYPKCEQACSSHGFSVGGQGGISLRSVTENACMPSDYKDFDGQPISPVLIQRATTNLTHLVPLGANTNIEKIQIDPQPVSEVLGYYANDTQTIRKGMGFFDLLKISDGETYLVFNQDIGPFQSGAEYPLWNPPFDSPTGEITNSKVNNNEWNKKSGVMMIGTYDGYNWNTPYLDINRNQPQKFLMILNAVEYLTSFYDSVERTFGIFVKCSNSANVTTVDSGDEETPVGDDFIAFFSISYLKLGHKAYNMTPIEEDEINSFSDVIGDSCCDDYKYEEYNLDQADAINKREY